MWKSLINTMMFAAILFALGCSSINDGNPATVEDDATEYVISADSDSRHMLWGMWNISFDPGEMEVIIEPLRDAQAHFNITEMLLPPNCYYCLTIKVNSFDTVTRILDADVTLRNPTNLSGHDVRGILYTNIYGHELLNADDWTSLWDVTGGMEINAFRAFAKDQPNRKFANHAVHTENYLLYIPIPPLYGFITYAVDASWPGNCMEPYEIDNFNQGEILDHDGSHCLVTVDVHDWQGNVNEVTLVAQEITGEEFTELAHQDGDTWGGELYNNAKAQSGDYEVRISATSSDSGSLALHDYAIITITPGPEVLDWARTWGGGATDRCHGIVVDGSGDIYVTGFFEETVDLDPGGGTDEHTSNGACDVFFSKFDSAGEFQWTRTWGGSDRDEGFGVAVDGSGNIYVSGEFWYTVDFDPGVGTDEHISNDGADISLCKYDSSGNFQWARTWGGIGWDSGYEVAVDGSGNIYVTGKFEDTVDFDPGDGTDEHASNGEYDVFLSKFDSAGDFQWARTWGGSDPDRGWGIATDSSGNIYVTGDFRESVDFDPGGGTDEHAANDWYDVFLSKFDSAGVFQWARTWGGSALDNGYGVATDSSGNIYVTGGFRKTVDFDPGGGTDEHTAYINSDIFLSKFDSSGDFQWARTWGASGAGEGWGVATDSSGNIYVTGWFQNVVDFDPGPGVDEHTSNGVLDVFLSKFDSIGIFQWAHTWGGSSWDRGYEVAIGGSGNAYTTGWFIGTVDFDPGGGTDEHTVNGWEDAFLSKFLPDGGW